MAKFGIDSNMVFDADGKSVATRLSDHDTSLDSLSSSLAESASALRDDEEALIISAFSGKNGSALDLHLTKDGSNFIPLNDDVLFSGEVRDASMIYKNGKFYVAFTRGMSPNVGFVIAVSDDLENWTQNTILMNSYSVCWAPEWFEDTNGDVYIFLTLGDGTHQNDIDGQSVYYTKQYKIKALDTSLLSFSTPTELVFNQVSNKIDSFIIKKDSTYYNFVKNEYNKTIEVYTSTDLLNFTYQYTVDSKGIYVEGPSVIFFAGKYHMYLDGFTTLKTLHYTSTDLVTWSAFDLTNSYGRRTQHFSPIKTNSDINKVINQFYKKRLAGMIFDYTSKPTSINIEKMLSGGVLNVVNDDDNVTYYVIGNKNLTITSINGNCNKFRFIIFAPTSQPSTITIKNGNNILTPNNIDFVFGQKYGYGETVIEMYKTVDGKYRVNAPNIQSALDFVNAQPLPSNYVNLETLATGGVINSLALQNNKVYCVFTQNITINAATFSDDGTVTPYRVYFTIFNTKASSAGITIKTGGGKIFTPLQNDFVMSAASYADVLVQFARPYSSASADGLRRVQ
jgi:hypothetical protein